MASSGDMELKAPQGLVALTLLCGSLTTALQCGACSRLKTYNECKARTQTCRAGEKCYIQKTTGLDGSVHYQAGCTTAERCRYMNFDALSVLGKRAPLEKHVCEKCCDDKDLCNMELCYGLHTVDEFHSAQTTSSTTTTTTTTTAPVNTTTCETCHGDLCGLALTKYSLECGQDKPFCMNTIENFPNGTKHVIKGCTSVSECRQKWWVQSSNQKDCQNLDINQLYPFHLTCSYCCTTDNCNKPLRPDLSTLYHP